MLLQEKNVMDEINIKRKKIFNKKDIAEMFGFGRDKTKRLLESGILPVTKLNRDYIISEEALNKWLKQNEGKQLTF